MIDIFDTQKRFAVNVKSEQEALDFLEWLESRGVEVEGSIEEAYDSWDKYGQTLCYDIEQSEDNNRYRVYFGGKEWYDREEYTVVKADEVKGFRESLSSSCEVPNSLTDFLIGIMGSAGKERKRACCNCGNNKRVTTESGHCDCFCSIDGHYIGYIECFEGWCRRWRKDRKYE